MYGELAGVEEVALAAGAGEDMLEPGLLCAAAAYIPDMDVLVIINPTNVKEARSREKLVGGLFTDIIKSSI